MEKDPEKLINENEEFIDGIRYVLGVVANKAVRLARKEGEETLRDLREKVANEIADHFKFAEEDYLKILCDKVLSPIDKHLNTNHE